MAGDRRERVCSVRMRANVCGSDTMRARSPPCDDASANHHRHMSPLNLSLPILTQSAIYNGTIIQHYSMFVHEVGNCVGCNPSRVARDEAPAALAALACNKSSVR
ncbi:hypothetical protein O0L34_g8225 [Tuta absoluta]|nr:hypothetical protein O0L34_g8225 [Tuta absoluta]